LFATGHSSLYNEAGEVLNDYALGDLFGAHLVNKPDKEEMESFNRTLHTYLRLNPEMRRLVYGPHVGNEPAITGTRHAVLKGYDETDIIPYGGVLKSLKTDPRANVIMTFIPEFPIYPPETAWMREPKTDIPGLILTTTEKGSRIAFMPADLDRQFSRYNLPDHGNLLSNIVRWASKDQIPLVVEGAGLIDCSMYQQSGRVILHITNLISAGTWRQPVDEYIQIGPITVKVKLPVGVSGESVNLLVAGQKNPAVLKDGWCHCKIQSILNHEVLVIT
jgi:hypothetical protein